jgi:Transglutaminase-like superfamily
MAAGPVDRATSARHPVRLALLQAHAFVLLAVARLGLPRLGLPRTMRLLAVLRVRGWPGQPPARLVGAVQRAGRALPGSGCLAESAAVAALLGHAAEAAVVLGCRLDGQEWTAHAWVEWRGGVLEPQHAEIHEELGRCNEAGGWRLVGSPGERLS